MVTGDFYVGSSKNVKKRWASHKWPSNWKLYPNNPLYQDMQKYGVDKFDFQIIISIMPECLLQIEQDCIDLMKPTYNRKRANKVDVKKRKKTYKKYRQSDKGKKRQKRYLDKLCYYNGETLTLRALSLRFHRAGMSHSLAEASKYLIK